MAKRELDLDVEDFLESVPPQLRELIELLRNLVFDAAPGVAETHLWGGISYHRPWIGGRVKGAVCGIGINGDLVQLGFIHGRSLPDPEGLLTGEGKSKREVEFASVEDVPQGAVHDLIRFAADFVPQE